MQQQTVRDIMTPDPVCVGPQTSLTDVARRMRDEDIGAVLVADEQNVTGVVTDRDIVVRALAGGDTPDSTPVRAACSSALVGLDPDASAEDAVRMMRTHAMRRMPVLDHGRPVGMVSLGDLAVDRDRNSVLADISAAPANR